MELTTYFFSGGDENFDFWEFAKKEKKDKRKGKGIGILLLPLRPWRPFIAKGIQKLGVKVERKGKGLKAAWYLDGKKLSFGQLVWLFGELVVKGKKFDKQNFENFSLALDSFEGGNWDGTEAWDGTEHANEAGKAARTGGAVADIAVKAATFDVAGLSSSLIQAIVNFIKKLRDKKKKGEKLTPIEEKLADAYDSTEDEVIQNVKDEIEEKTGEAIFSPKTLMLLAAAVVVAFIVLRKK